MKKFFKKISPPFIIDLVRYLKSKYSKNNEAEWHEVKSGPLEGKEIFVNSNNGYFSQMVEGVYDEYLYKSIEDVNFKGKTIIDVGCHIGYNSLVFSELVGNTGQVFAIDPNPYNLHRFRKIIDRNSTKNIKIFNLGVSNEVGKMRFNFSRNVDNMNSSGGFIEGTKTTLPSSEFSKKGFVDGVIDTEKLDNLISKQSINDISLIKIDVEGHEASVLEGGLKVLKETLPIVLLEIHTIRAMYDTSRIMYKLGYNSDILYEEEDGRLFLKYYKD